jgi:PTH1 family peptidyl-tRNA hydrolase
MVVGLGNPGPTYEGTRHNVGFDALDCLAQQWALTWHWDGRSQGLLAKKNLLSEGGQGEPLWLLKPQVFMNVSGHSVAALARFFKLEAPHILVIHDDIDLLPGVVKLKQGGGHAGHNGLKSIDAQLGTRDYWRLRIGVGRPAIQAQVVNWVLQTPSSADRKLMGEAIDRGLTAIHALIEGLASSVAAGRCAVSSKTQSTTVSAGT